MKIRSGCEGGGKGALVQEEKSATLACNNDQTLFQPKKRKEVIAIDKESYSSGEGFDRKPGITVGGPCVTLQAQGVPHAVCYEWHSQDLRVKEVKDATAPTLPAAMGMGGASMTTPMLLCEQKPVVYSGDTVTSPINKANPQPGDPCHTLGTDSRNYLVEPVICLQGNGIDRADNAGCNGKGWKEDTSYTLNTIDRPAVVYSFDSLASNSMKSKNPHSGCREVEVAKTLDTTDPNPSKNQGGIAVVQPAYGLDRASFNQGQNAKFDFTITEESQPTLTARGPGAVAQQLYHSSKASFSMRASEDGTADTLVATDYKDPQLIAYDESPKRYIVRRLTPTECARLQGFADRWGDIDAIDRMSAKDYQFWKEVRNTHARINGKKVQDYTVKQMLAWYNKLQTDSAEYKMWGNGIALPTALYAIQGIQDALHNTESEIEDWML